MAVHLALLHYLLLWRKILLLGWGRLYELLLRRRCLYELLLWRGLLHNNLLRPLTHDPQRRMKRVLIDRPSEHDTVARWPDTDACGRMKYGIAATDD
jgi:hypothetical protein